MTQHKRTLFLGPVFTRPLVHDLRKGGEGDGAVYPRAATQRAID